MLPLSDPDLLVRKTPYVTITFITLCSVVFLYELLIGTIGKYVLFYQYGLLPTEIISGKEINDSNKDARRPRKLNVPDELWFCATLSNSLKFKYMEKFTRIISPLLCNKVLFIDNELGELIAQRYELSEQLLLKGLLA